MSNLGNPPMAAATTLLVFFIAFFLLTSLHPTDGQIGVAYGGQGNNLFTPQQVVNLYKSNNIGAMRIYYPDHKILQALKNSGIALTLGVGKNDIQPIGSGRQSAADQWVQTNVLPYASTVKIKYIVVGNEIKKYYPQLAQFVGPAMQKMLNALNSNNLGDKIKVTTSISTGLVSKSYPPSNGQFNDLGFMNPIITFLINNNSPLMVSIYPYFAHKSKPRDISLEYALFTMPQNQAVRDNNNGLKYQNVFDALVDATYAAIDKVAGAVAVTAAAGDGGLAAEMAGGSKNLRLIASESGWSSSNGGLGTRRRLLDGGDGATVENAKTYYTKLIEHVKKGTPLKPGVPIETFLFEMFDEDTKRGDADEQHFGLFTPDMQSKYGSLNFSGYIDSNSKRLSVTQKI